MNNAELYTFNLDIQVRWFDLDPFNHVNNSVYFQYFEIARSKYIHAVSQQWDWSKHQFVLAQTSCDFKKEIKLNNEGLKVWVRTSRLGSKSFDLQYAITSGKTDSILHSTGSSVQVMIDAEAGGTTKIPEWLRAQFLTYEKEGSISR